MIHTVRHREQVLADMKRFLQDEAGESLETEVAMENEIETELAFQIADRYITIQEVTDGYDHTIYDMNFKELDGGVYDNPDIGIRERLYLYSLRVSPIMSWMFLMLLHLIILQSQSMQTSWSLFYRRLYHI